MLCEPHRGVRQNLDSQAKFNICALKQISVINNFTVFSQLVYEIIVNSSEDFKIIFGNNSKSSEPKALRGWPDSPGKLKPWQACQHGQNRRERSSISKPRRGIRKQVFFWLEIEGFCDSRQCHSLSFMSFYVIVPHYFAWLAWR
jgi:hypothetical protein